MILLQLIVYLSCAHGITAVAKMKAQSKESIAVTFEGQKSGTTVRFNCSLQRAPPSKTVQFLVNSITANNIRLYQGECYLTHKGSPCSLFECQCSKDGKRYFWTYEEAKETFTATCKARIKKGCNINATIQFTDTNLAPHKTITTTCETTGNTDGTDSTSGTMCCTKSSSLLLLLCLVIQLQQKIGRELLNHL
ncbi:uncharacterized protein [Mytilus edulis]|uniref:uncharacterized protein n=1 Tax=Mytilus edulis TaxID=6550 RepID=UPI0039F004DD